ncbi:adenylate/guanylate cyclase domain-containing protein [Microvirga sp. 17 mud 1-3]|uniref:adenylate/guanylate cyclase domain-containing protein n=1 Tax=Microvirga sp. 17 mud 1-3 TaxID=2082949 RepID=UPI000D6B4B49|nr:adenylate/guanylate cyclase domain-containing protein [Microvirga sp. 17 mud 1-3]AWM85374.1 adenylate/guanylate cyclase domain-containing protein [Microvirga sp. 17 mud 1-3]
MDAAQATRIVEWVTGAGLAGMAETELMRGFCSRLVEAGLPVARANMGIDTLHPVLEGRIFRWVHDAEFEPISEYGRLVEGTQAEERWRRSPYFHLYQEDQEILRRRIGPDHPCDFAILDDLHREGQTDYVALMQRFSAQGAIGEMDCIFSSWTTAVPQGFSDGEIETLRRLVPSLALAMKCSSLTRIAETLVETYLGRDAGRRVLNGRIARGVTDRIQAVLWFSDLHGFTHIADTSAPDEIIPFLNDYSEAIISSIHEAGGDVLKLIGDGTLAIFKTKDQSLACRQALAAEEAMRRRIKELNRDRGARGLPTTEAYLGLHVGEVFYGNIGSRERLDFTVVGPAVNETSRIAALCHSVERSVLVSSAFQAAAQDEDRRAFVSVGRYALRGVKRPQELFTLESALED